MQNNAGSKNLLWVKATAKRFDMLCSSSRYDCKKQFGRTARTNGQDRKAAVKKLLEQTATKLVYSRISHFKIFCRSTLYMKTRFISEEHVCIKSFDHKQLNG